MPRIAKYSRERIIDVAFAIVREQGGGRTECTDAGEPSRVLGQADLRRVREHGGVAPCRLVVRE